MARDLPTKGWICPSCGRGMAPGEKYCDHGTTDHSRPLLPIIPGWPPTLPQRAEEFMPICGCRIGTVCMMDEMAKARAA